MKLFLAALIFAGAALAQIPTQNRTQGILSSTPTVSQPGECFLSGVIKVTVNSGSGTDGKYLDNRTTDSTGNQISPACDLWVVSWYASSNIGVGIETEFQVTADVNGAPGPWIAGQASGQFYNPQIGNAVGSIQFPVYAPWVRFNVDLAICSPNCSVSAPGIIYYTIRGSVAPPVPLTTNTTMWFMPNATLFGTFSGHQILSTFGFSCLALEIQGPIAATITVQATNDPTGAVKQQIGNYSNPGIYTIPITTQFVYISTSAGGSGGLYLSNGSNCWAATNPPFALGSTVTAVTATATVTSSIDQVYGSKTIELQVIFAGITHGAAIAGCNAQLKSSNDDTNFATVTTTTNNLGAAGVIPDGASSQFITYTAQPIGEFVEWVYTCGTFPTAGTIQFVPVFK